MRYTDILNEENNPDQLIELWPTIQQECSEIVDVYKTNKRMFYRGVTSRSGVPQDIFQSAPREDRVSRSNEQWKHQWVNQGFATQGWSTNRSNSVAMTNILSEATRYGKAYMIFPKNGFKFLFGNVEDLHGFVTLSPDDFAKFASGKFNIKTPARYLDEKEFKDILARVQQRNPHAIKEFWDSQLGRYGFHYNTNINLALEGGFEVMMSGAEYYAVSYDRFSKVIWKLIRGDAL